jgi:hypothetical protein
MDSKRFAQVVQAIQALDIHHDLAAREEIINYFIRLLQGTKENHWLGMEVMNAIQNLELRDGRVVAFLETYLKQGIQNDMSTLMFDRY